MSKFLHDADDGDADDDDAKAIANNFSFSHNVFYSTR